MEEIPDSFGGWFSAACLARYEGPLPPLVLKIG